MKSFCSAECTTKKILLLYQDRQKSNISPTELKLDGGFGWEQGIHVCLYICIHAAVLWNRSRLSV